MLPEKMETALNDQVKHEFASAYAYLAMAAHCESQNYPGFAHWLKVQAQEEVEHAMRFYEFINDRGGRVLLQPIPAPKTDFTSMIEVFETVLAHEQKVTKLIHDLYTLANAEKDYASYPFLQEFITEQIEEEKLAADTLAMVKMTANESRALFLLDRELVKRQG